MKRGRTLLSWCALLLALPASASARVERAGTVLPPGQSGFVSAAGLADGSGSPHLFDQTELFVQFRFKAAEFGQPGEEEIPRPGVRIVRDSFGVPAITADTTDDAWFGAGYAVAQDRLFQLEAFRRATSGRLSEILGRGMLEMDIESRRDYYTRSEVAAQLAAVPPELRARFDAYRDGVNAWIQRTREDPSLLPGEFAALGTAPADWSSLDSAAIGVFLARTVPSGDGEELANMRALAALGRRRFNDLLPLRIRGQVPTVPRSEGLFPSQPGRTRAQERRAFRRSAAFLAGVPQPRAQAEPSAAARRLAGLGRTGGSNMWATRDADGGASMFNGPQLGFQVPELFVEFELHAPGLDVRGVTAPGVPVIGIGHNEHVAWGFTSGLSDEDDLYVEQLVGEEGYRFRGETRAMECRDERFDYRPPPTELLGLTGGEVPDTSSGTHTERICRTVHGPVQVRGTGVAYARRYAIWGRELETLTGLAAVNEARSVADVDRAMDLVTWNENVVAADDQGNIGYWHPGLHPLRPRNWDERLPYPGTGEAEWRGFLPPDRRPQVVNPEQGYLFQWNNIPSEGWTTGDAPARERVTGPFHRAAFLRRVVAAARRDGGGYDRVAHVDRVTGTVAQNRPLASRRLKAARRAARGPGRVVLDTILAWDGSYDRVDENDTVDPGVAAFDAFKAAAIDVALPGVDREALGLVEGGRSSSHEFDVTLLEAYALRTLGSRGYRRAAALAHAALERRFQAADPARWREPRRMYEPGSQGAASFAPFPFFDRGTYQQAVELGP